MMSPFMHIALLAFAEAVTGQDTEEALRSVSLGIHYLHPLLQPNHRRRREEQAWAPC